MVFFRIMSVQWWCIFILFSQRMVDCASFFSSGSTSSGGSSTSVISSLCGEAGETREQYVSDKGPSSSVLLALQPVRGAATTCKRQIRAPDAYNFFVRLQRSPEPAGPGRHSSTGKSYTAGTKAATNSTHSCPLTISQSGNGELLPAWRLDPCLLESGGQPEEPMRLLQGKLNIVWHHDGNAPRYRLQLTVVGQGAACLERDRHSCLEYVGMPLLCIARELVCDGLPNCPPLGSEVSDENDAMCAKHRRDEYMESPVHSVFRKYIQNTIKSFFGGEPDGLPSAPAPPALSSTPATVDIGQLAAAVSSRTASYPPAPSANEPTASPPPPAKKQRSSMTGLSKYGPWGYLFLGMLICGGALLICGLWECCCRSHKPERSPDDSLPDPVPSFLQTSPGDGASSARSPASPVPSYGDLDPPPAYSVLFPNQKPSDVSVEEGAVVDVLDSAEPRTDPPRTSSASSSAASATSTASLPPDAVETREGNEADASDDANEHVYNTTTTTGGGSPSASASPSSTSPSVPP